MSKVAIVAVLVTFTRGIAESDNIELILAPRTCRIDGEQHRPGYTTSNQTGDHDDLEQA